MTLATVGIALAPDRIATTAWSRPLAPRPAGEGEWDDLRVALGELRERLGAAVPRAAIALLPPLAHARVLELPLLRREEYARIIGRDAARYFPTGRTPHVAGGEPLGRGSPAPVLAAVAASDLVEAIVRAVVAAGWELDSLVPAECAWLPGRGRGRGRERATLIIPLGAVVEVLRVQDGAPVAVRRVPAAAASAPDLVAELSREGETVRVLDDPQRAAAAGAVRARDPELVPERVAAERRRGARRLTLRLAAAALGLLVVAAALDLWGASRQLAAVAGRRAALRADVAVVLTRQDTLESLTARHAALARLDAGATRWSEVLADFSDYLPRDAHFVVFRGRADSVGLEGIAQHAAGVFAALRRAGRVAGVRADAPIRQEPARPGAPPVERFAVAARLAGEAAPPSAERRP